jgi:hypothetical protein
MSDHRDDPRSGETPDSSSVPQLVDAKRTAAQLGISLRSLHEITTSRLLPSLKIGRRRLYDLRDVVAFVEAGKREGATR